jgi:hypothetical protein
VAAPLLPDDPNDWTDDEWLAWLEEGDAAERDDSHAGPERPVLPAWRKGPVAMQFLALSMRAVGEAIYGKRDEPAIVVDAPGDPPNDDDPLQVTLDFEHPEQSQVVVRKWLLRQPDPEVEEIVEQEPRSDRWPG